MTATDWDGQRRATEHPDDAIAREISWHRQDLDALAYDVAEHLADRLADRLAEGLTAGQVIASPPGWCVLVPQHGELVRFPVVGWRLDPEHDRLRPVTYVELPGNCVIVPPGIELREAVEGATVEEIGAVQTRSLALASWRPPEITRQPGGTDRRISPSTRPLAPSRISTPSTLAPAPMPSYPRDLDGVIDRAPGVEENRRVGSQGTNSARWSCDACGTEPPRHDAYGHRTDPERKTSIVVLCRTCEARPDWPQLITRRREYFTDRPAPKERRTMSRRDQDLIERTRATHARLHRNLDQLVQRDGYDSWASYCRQQRTIEAEQQQRAASFDPAVRATAAPPELPPMQTTEGAIVFMTKLEREQMMEHYRAGIHYSAPVGRIEVRR